MEKKEQMKNQKSYSENEKTLYLILGVLLSIGSLYVYGFIFEKLMTSAPFWIAMPTLLISVGFLIGINSICWEAINKRK